VTNPDPLGEINCLPTSAAGSDRINVVLAQSHLRRQERTVNMNLLTQAKPIISLKNRRERAG
jgi:hypothetical protein